MDSIQKIIDDLNLEPLHGEGGFFRQTYKSDIRFDCSSILSNATKLKSRAASTAIYYLVTPGSFSALHRLPSDEVFHFYLGSPVQMVNWEPDGSTQKVILGQGIFSGETLQHVVPAGTWQGTKLLKPEGFALMGVTVAPGFEFEDMEMATMEMIENLDVDSKELLSGYIAGNN